MKSDPFSPWWVLANVATAEGVSFHPAPTGVQTIGFYRDIVQHLKAWQAPAPKLRAAVAAPAEQDSLEEIIAPVAAAIETPTDL